MAEVASLKARAVVPKTRDDEYVGHWQKRPLGLIQGSAE
jgi:hypothetical protein